MEITPQPISIYRKLNSTQLQRIQDHEASATSDGQLKISVEMITTPKGLQKKNNVISVIPKSTEKVITITEMRDSMFADLQHMNAILTNACNLQCSYCYEQHNKDYGRFTDESILKAYNFLLNINSNSGKKFQFFGGEPLIHKDLIIGFLKNHKDYLISNMNRQHVGMITNGILLTPDFIEEFFNYAFVNMTISLDTMRADVDHREIGQDRIDKIIDMIGLIPQSFKDNHMVGVRCTLSRENAPYLVEFVSKLFDKGLRTMVVHPLTMSSRDGYIHWSEEEWKKLHQDILYILDNFYDFEIQFAEGVGVKEENNCMVGSDMIAIDGSGDFSGCYFFTNQKEKAADTILGNIFEDKLYIDRYDHFQKAYKEMFIVEEQCKTCDLQNFCYQCPAGNMDASGRMFRPDDMCQKVVRLFLDLQNDLVKKGFQKKYKDLLDTVAKKGEQPIFAKAISHLMYKHITGFHIPVGEVDTFIDQLPDYKLILGRFYELAKERGRTYRYQKALSCACDYLTEINESNATPLTIKEFYEKLCELHGTPVRTSQQITELSLDKRIFYLALLHMLVLNNKGEKLDDKLHGKKIVNL